MSWLFNPLLESAELLSAPPPPISASNFTSVGGASASSLATSSLSPTDKVYLVAVNSRTGISTDPNVPTLSGWGITWNQIATAQHDIAGSSRKRITLFWGYNASPSSGTLTADFGGQTQTDMGIVVDEITGADTTSPIVQSTTATDDTITVSTLTATLGAFADTDNATYSAGGIGSVGSTFTPGTGFATVSDLGTGTSNRLSTQFKNTNDTSVDMSWSANEEIGIIAVEIGVAGSGTTVTPGVATLTLTTFAPTVTTSNNQLVTPGVATLSLTGLAPQLKSQINTGLATLTLTTFAPSVTIGVRAVPDVATLTLTTYAPQIKSQINTGLATLTLTTFAPQVNLKVVPNTTNLTFSTFAPTVSVSNNQSVTPGVATLTLTTFVPTVATSNNQVVTPSLVALTLTTFAPTVTGTAGITATPDLATLVLSGYAPLVEIGVGQLVIPDVATLIITTYAPIVTGNHFTAPPSEVIDEFTPQTPSSDSGFTPVTGLSGDWIVSDPDPSGSLDTQSAITGSFTPQT